MGETEPEGGVWSVQVEEGDDLPQVLRFLARLHEEPAVMECEADHLLHVRNDVHVAQPVDHHHPPSTSAVLPSKGQSRGR